MIVEIVNISILNNHFKNFSCTHTYSYFIFMLSRFKLTGSERIMLKAEDISAFSMVSFSSF